MPTTDPRRRRRGGGRRRPARKQVSPRRGVVALLGALVVIALVVVVGRAVLDRASGLLPPSCTVADGSNRVDLDPEQASNASLIGAVAVRRKLPARAATIAIATAMQESKLRNLDHGDRDSLGLFQQRPSQGWGTQAQVSDPRYATETFYDRLVQVRDWRTLPLTQVAQSVQRSGYPEAYAQHEGDAALLAAAFTGARPRAVTCAFTPDATAAPGSAAQAGADIEDVFGVTAKADGEALSVGTDSAAGTAAVAAWCVAHAYDRRIAGVVSQGYTWTASRSSAWARGGNADTTTTRVTFHR